MCNRLSLLRRSLRRGPPGLAGQRAAPSACGVPRRMAALSCGGYSPRPPSVSSAPAFGNTEGKQRTTISDLVHFVSPLRRRAGGSIPPTPTRRLRWHAPMSALRQLPRPSLPLCIMSVFPTHAAGESTYNPHKKSVGLEARRSLFSIQFSYRISQADTTSKSFSATTAAAAATSSSSSLSSSRVA